MLGTPPFPHAIVKGQREETANVNMRQPQRVDFTTRGHGQRPRVDSSLPSPRREGMTPTTRCRHKFLITIR